MMVEIPSLLDAPQAPMVSSKLISGCQKVKHLPTVYLPWRARNISIESRAKEYAIYKQSLIYQFQIFGSIDYLLPRKNSSASCLMV